jgi:transcription initiation factor IIE alpha subunit
MADRLGIDVNRVDRALARLLDAGLVDLRPWRPGSRDGVWQILPVERSVSARSGKCMSVADLLQSLGVMPHPVA